MGLRTHNCLLLLSAMCMMVAFVSQGIALGSPNWILERVLENPDNYTNKGLWEVCVINCTSYVGEAAEQSWLVTTQVLFVLSTGLALFCGFCYGAIVLCPFSETKMYGIIWFIACCQVVAFIFTTIAMTTFSKYATGKMVVSPPGTTRTLYWAYYVAWFGDLFIFLAFMCLLGEIIGSIKWYRAKKYENIQ